MKTIRTLGMGEREAEKNGVSREDYFKSLANVSTWHGLPPYKVDQAVGAMKECLNTCPKCNVFLHETNIDSRAPRTETNQLLTFKQGEYCCKKCTKKEDVRYFEFTQHEYYALIVIKEKDEAEALEKAFELYVEFAAGDSVKEVKEEGFPTQLTHEQAWARYFKEVTRAGTDEKTHELYERFYDREDDILLIDGDLS